MLADGAPSVEKRRAVVATFVLEVARRAVEAARQQQSDFLASAGGAGRGRGSAGPRTNLARTWTELRLLIEWACGLMRSAPVPSPSERLWALASLAIAPDIPFIIGPPNGTSVDRFMDMREQYGAALAHGLHFRSRPSSDSRLSLVLLDGRYGTRGAAYLVSRRAEFTPAQVTEKQRQAQAIISRRRQPGLRATDASGNQVSFSSPLDEEVILLVDLLSSLREKKQELDALDPPEDARAEVRLQLGTIALSFADRDAALQHFSDAERYARTGYDRYLSSFLQGRVYELQNRVVDAESSYRRALEAVPRAQSAVTALARLQFVDGRRSDASALVAGMHASPSAADPWLEFVDTGCDRWPDLIAELRKTLK